MGGMKWKLRIRPVAVKSRGCRWRNHSFSERLLRPTFFFEYFDTLFIWRLRESTTTQTIIADVFWPIHVVQILHLNLPPRPPAHSRFLDKAQGFLHARCCVEYHFIGPVVVRCTHDLVMENDEYTHNSVLVVFLTFCVYSPVDAAVPAL